MAPQKSTHSARSQTSIRFYLNRPRNRGGSIILVSVSHPDFRLKLSTGVSIPPPAWNPNSQRPRKGHPNCDELTAYLDKLEQSIKTRHYQCKLDGQGFTPEAIRAIISESTGRGVVRKAVGFYESYREYLTLKRGKLSDAFLAKMEILMRLVQDFEKRYGYPITFESINLDFHERFTSYLTNDRGQLDSTSNKYIALLKSFMNWSLKLKKHTSVDFKDSDFRSTPVDSELIALTLDEVMALFRMDLEQGSRLYNVREFFCFQCFTGLRYSEVVGITAGNVRGDELYFREHKTKSLRVKALNEQALTILQRNGYAFHGISNQKLNVYLKELGRMAGITAPVQVVKYRGSERIELVKPKFEFMTTHVSRASYITISLQLKVPVEVVKRDTGHSSDSSFRRYIRFADGYSSSVMRNAWSNKGLLNGSV